MNVSVILTVLAVALLALVALVVLVWPGLSHVARVLGVLACVSGVVMLIAGSQLMLWVFVALVVAAALIGLVRPHRRTRRRWAEYFAEQSLS